MKACRCPPRMDPGESLFDRTPPGTPEELRKPFCLCPGGLGPAHHGGAGTSCIAYENVDHTSVFPSVDTTVEYVRSGEGAESMPDASSPPLGRSVWASQSAPQPGEDPGEGLPQASAGFRPVLGHAQLDEFAYRSAEARQEAQPRWPTPSGLSRSKALVLCQLALANSTVGAACGGLLGRRLDEAVDLCVLDLQLKDDLGWTEALLPYLENECERRLLENGTRRSLEGPDPTGAAAEVAAALRCPGRCHGHGECTPAGCRCSSSHSSYDCSRALGECPDAGPSPGPSRLTPLLPDASPAGGAEPPGERRTLRPPVVQL